MKNGKLRGALLASSGLALIAVMNQPADAAPTCTVVSNPVSGYTITGNQCVTVDDGVGHPISVTNPTGNTVNAAGGAGSVNAISVINGSTITGNIINNGTLNFNGAAIYVYAASGSGVRSGVGGQIVNSGTLMSNTGTSSAIDIRNSDIGAVGGVSVVNQTGATIQVTNNGYAVGILLNPGSNASGTIVNNGTITINNTAANPGASPNAGIDLIAATATGIVNGGTINANRAIEVTGKLGTVAHIAGDIVNNGTINASGSNAIAVFGYKGGAAAQIDGSIINNGMINAATTGSGMYISSTTIGGSITNNGTIIAKYGAVSIKDDMVNNPDHSSVAGGIINNGTMTVGSTAIWLPNGASVAFITNNGTITSAINEAIYVVGEGAATTINQAGGTITGNIRLSALADVVNVTGGTINGNIIGQGTSNMLNFTLGTGTFTYGASYGFTGINQVNINSGTVILNGTNTATSINVNGGTLEGTGTLDPLAVTINSGAVFAPGAPGSPGTSMKIEGNLTFNSGAIYLVQLDPSNTTSVNVTGTAMLSGKVLAAFNSGTYTNKQYDILHAGTVSGTFDSAATTNLPSGFSATLNYTSTDVYLNLTATLGNNAGLNTNDQNVANALNNYFNGGGTLTSNFAQIFALSGGNLATALSELSGEAATAGETTAFQAFNEFLGIMLDPTVDGRGGAGGALGFAPEQQANLPPEVALAYASILKAPLKPAPAERRWSAWASGFGGYNKTDGDPSVGSNDVTANTWGFASGLDYHFTPDLVAGFALAGGSTNWDLSQGLGSGRSDFFQAGLYSTLHMGPAYLAASFAFANYWVSTDRYAPFGDHLTASFNAQSYGGRGEVGYRIPVAPTFSVIPYAAVQAQSYHMPAYSETDVTGSGFGLSYASSSPTDTRSELGARFEAPTMLNGMPLIVRARLAWAHDWMSDPSLTATFQTLPGASFVVNGATPPADSALASLGTELHLTSSWSLLGRFDGGFASDAQTYAGTGTLRYTW